MKTHKCTTGLIVFFFFAAAFSFQILPFSSVAQGVGGDVEYPKMTEADIFASVLYKGNFIGDDAQGHPKRRCPLRP